MGTYWCARLRRVAGIASLAVLGCASASHFGAAAIAAGLLDQSPGAPKNLRLSGPHPLIANVAVTGVTTSAATISWVTDRASDSQVDYGTTTSYGQATPRDLTLLTFHTVTLTGLTSTTRYYFRVASSDGSGRQSTSPRFTFTTATAPDTTAPAVALTAPAAGTTVSGTVTVSAAASDGVGVSGVQFKLNGANLGPEGTSGPYSVSWNTTTGANGSYTLTAVARDAAGNTSASADVSVTVANDSTPPSVSITSPAAGATVSATVSIAAGATDNIAVVGVQFQLDGTPLGTEDVTSPYGVTWNSTTAAPGPHTLRAVARDAAGNRTTSASVAINVANAAELVLPPLDTFIGLNDQNNSANPQLFTYTWPDNRVANAILLKFDLSSVPSGMVIQEATLRLALVSSDSTTDAGYTVTAHKIVTKNPLISAATGYTADGATTWTANACCSDGVPLAQADISSAYDAQTLDKTPGYKNWTITAMAQEWLANPAANFGVLLNSDPAKLRDRFRSFASTENTDAALRPFLRIVYAPSSDTTPPSVSVSAPASGATVSGTIAVNAGASDNAGVAGVQFKINGANLGAEDTAAPYSVSWNTTAVPDGSYTLAAVARDAAGNKKVSTSVTVQVANTAPPAGGIAKLYPGDVGIEGHPDVVFVERFEDPLSTIFLRWTDTLNGPRMALTSDVPAGSSGTRSLDIPWQGGGVSNGGHLYKQISPVDDVLYVRYYIKYPAAGKYQHDGIWMGGYNPALAAPNPQAGSKPAGNDRFSAAPEQTDDASRFDHYNYWMNMRMAPDGKHWGNTLLGNPNVKLKGDQWVCVEQMVRLNNPVTAFNGEHAIWLDGVKVSHLGAGFPNGSWSGGNFTQNTAGSPFEGFRWRSDSNLKLNWIWLQNYSPNDPAGFVGHMKFDHVVVAKSQIGCLASSAGADNTPPVVEMTAPQAGTAVGGESVTVSANASDNVGIAGVQFELDGVTLGAEDTTTPYSVSWNTSATAGGTHSLTAVARDAAGNVTRSAVVSVTVVNASTPTRLQPLDTYLKLDATNYSTTTTLAAYTWPDRQAANAILMKFDLSVLPPGANVQDARLELSLVESDASADSSYSITAHKVVGATPLIAAATGYTADGVTGWTPNACCSGGVPLAQGNISAAYDTRAIDKSAGRKAWTITGMVREWISDPAGNRGVVLNPDTSKLRDRYRYFASMEHTDASLRPALYITYSMAADLTAPVVAITEPLAAAAVSGTVSVSAAATDDVGVAGVQFRIDGAALGAEVTAPPYTIRWETSSAANGTRTLTAVARDAAGRAATSSPITVTVANGELTVRWNGNPEPDLAGYRLYIGEASGVYSRTFDVGLNTSHTVTGLSGGRTYYAAVSAYDASGNMSGLSQEVSATVPPR